LRLQNSPNIFLDICIFMMLVSPIEFPPTKSNYRCLVELSMKSIETPEGLTQPCPAGRWET
jgi:hypothetical protein